ncbi:MAG: S8 family peptidase [Lachnospiraceae bacterium]|nr:S8 family peptidase [Lachnospiraceae bacterium]
MPECQDMIYSNEYADYVLNYSNPAGRTILSETVCHEFIDSEYAVVHEMRRGEGIPIQDWFRFQSLPRLFGLLDTTHLESSGVSKVRRLPELDLYGQGVIIGIIDTGIDYRHPAFINGDHTSRIGVIWDQSIPSENPPKDFGYGSVYFAEQINEALASDTPYDIVPSKDENGHGTLLAGIAGGNRIEEEDFSGVAPLCELSVVKLKEAKLYLREFWQIPDEVTAFQETDLFLGIRFIAEYAAEKNKPFVLLLGCGTNSGNHGGSSYLKNYLDKMSLYAGRSIVLAAGNEGSLGHHYKGFAAEMEEYQDVELQVGEGEKGFFLEFWAQAPDTYTVGLFSPRGEYVEKVPLSVGVTGSQIRFSIENTKILIFYGLLDPSSAGMLIWIRMESPTPGTWRLRIFRESVILGRYDIWLPMEHFISQDTYFLRPDPDTTICEPGNGANPMTVTAYNHKNGNLYYQASRGFTRENGIKPDFAAPGVTVYGPAKNGRYRTGTGTSIAAAVTAGCAALLLEKNHRYSGFQIKNLLIRGTAKKNLTYPNKEWGYGEIDLYKSLGSIR